MQALDLLVVNSRQEPLALTVVEGFSAHVPVLGARIGGIPEMIEHGVTGWLTSARDPRTLADDIVSIASDPELMEEISEAAFALAKSKFTLGTLHGEIFTSRRENGKPIRGDCRPRLRGKSRTPQ